MVWREITAEQLNNFKDPLVVDVRSPGEHAAERIPDSVNIPLLSDQERVEVGIIYKNEGELVARRHALKLISPKIPIIVEQILALKKHGQSLVVYCWRGGLRSEAVVSVLSVAGIESLRLAGGYKAWRGQVLKDLSESPYDVQPIILHGHTGVGKTEILASLTSKGLHVLDLEQLANHRGSVFGGLGLPDQPSQKNFDALLWRELKRLKDPRPPLFMEAESRKIGKLALPDRVLAWIQSGVPVLVTGSLEARAKRIAADYLRGGDKTDLQRGISLLGNLKERLGAKTVAVLETLVMAGEIEEAIKILLVQYYDPLYNRQIERAGPFALQVDGDHPELAAEQIAKWLQKGDLIKRVQTSSQA